MNYPSGTCVHVKYWALTEYIHMNIGRSGENASGPLYLLLIRKGDFSWMI